MFSRTKSVLATVLLFGALAVASPAESTTTRWANIDVRANWPIQPGDTIYVKGSGYIPDRTAMIRLGTTGNAFPMVHSDTSFDWTPVWVPTFLETGRSHQLRVNQYDSVEDREAHWDIYMPNFEPWAYPSSWYVYPGETVTFSARQFMAGETVNVAVDGVQVGSGQTSSAFDTEGQLNDVAPYVVPDSAAGTSMRVVLTGQTSEAQAMFDLSVGRR